MKRLKNMRKELRVYLGILAFISLALAMNNNIYSNYFKEAYQVTAYQRGLIEFPRELPGILCVFLIAGLSFIGDIRLSIIAQTLAMIGVAVLGFFTPAFTVMLIFIFINSLGMHLFMPLQDSIGLDLIEDKSKTGKRMGQYKGVSTAFMMVGSIIVFVGFRFNIFSFTTKIKWVFVLSAFLLLIAIGLLIYLAVLIKKPMVHRKKVNFIFRKEYKYYYVLAVMFGVQKQIMLVYGPWVLIDLLSKKADTLAVLSIIGAFAGIFFIPAVGRWMDRFGIKKILLADGLSFVGVFLIYGLLSAGFVTNTFSAFGLPVLLAYLVIIADKMSNQMGLVRVVYLKSILIKESDLTPTLSLGLSIDHVVSIGFAYIGGIVWSTMGPQYVFFITAALSLINVFVATQVKEK